MKFLRRTLRVSVLLLVMAVVWQQNGSAQFKEDALRLAAPGYGVGARSLGLGNAYTGVANDFSAIFWNPAGLAQARYGEFSFGLSHLNNKNTSTFMKSTDVLTSNGTSLNTLGLVFPVPVRQGSLVFAFGFNRSNNFTSGVSFEGFNPTSSIIQDWAPDGTRYPEDISLAEELEVAHADTVTGTFISPIKGNLTQRGEATEKGGLNNWSVGGAVDIAKNLSAGVTLTYVSGSYKYEREYRELAARGAYGPPFDLQELEVEDYIDGDVSGVNAKFGLMYRIPERFRFGIAIKTPTSFSVKEEFGTNASSMFYSADPSGNNSYGPIENTGSSEYDVHTPWVFSAGMSLILRSIMLSGDIDYTDWTELEFARSNSDLDVRDLNREIRDAFKATMSLRGGAEIDLDPLGLRLRGGFIYHESPYKGDPSSFDQKYITGGLGVELGEATMLDLGYAYGWWNTYRVNYNGSPRVDEKIRTNTFMLALTHRF